MKKLLLVSNSSSIHTVHLKSLIAGYFDESFEIDSRDFSIHNLFRLFRSTFSAQKLLRRFTPSMIILYQVDFAAFIVSMLKGKTPTLVVGIGSDILVTPDKNRLYRYMAKYVINHGDFFNAGSIAIKEKMLSLANRPIDIVIANLGTEDIVPKKKENIIYSNRLNKPFYNLDSIVKGFARFVANDANKDWKLVMAGFEQKEQLQHLAKDLNIDDKVEFVGWLNEKDNAENYAKSKIYVSLALSDSISISLLEAMSAECLPVIYDVPAIKGFITNGKNAVIVKDLDDNFFQKALALCNEKILKENRIIARKFSDKALNRQKFFSIFDKAIVQ